MMPIELCVNPHVLQFGALFFLDVALIVCVIFFDPVPHSSIHHDRSKRYLFYSLIILAIVILTVIFQEL